MRAKLTCVHLLKDGDFARFWSKTARMPNGCLEWTAARQRIGYGEFGFQDMSRTQPIVMMKAHRVAWEMTHGRIPDGMNVLHRCDNRACVDPSHLFLGTQADNVRDMLEKGRSPVLCGQPGSKHPLSKLTEDDVREIRRLAIGPRGAKVALARRFGITKTTVTDIVNRRTWTHVA